MVMTSMYTDESAMSSGTGVGPGGYAYFENAYSRNRDVSIFLKSIEQASDEGTVNEERFNRLSSEAHFVRAYIYFALAKRYGGVPIIDWLQDDDYDGDATPLFIPRSTELDTWKFVLGECDKAIQYLPTADTFTSDDGNPLYRATKWAAYALKSRAALYAASLAKYSSKTPFSGEAASQKLVGIDASEAAFFYNECIAASKAIIDDSGHSLYMSNPSSPEEAARN